MNFVKFRRYQNPLSNKEQVIVGLLIGLTSMMVVFDVFLDWRDGVPLTHIISEVFITLLTLSIAGYLFFRFAGAKNEAIEIAWNEKLSATEEAIEWKEKTKEIKAGLSAAISSQLKLWHLTEAEEDIALFLIKGLSINEIAKHRATSTQTTRQQASMIYKKSKLFGRAQLSAFFLEDLLCNLELPN